MVASEFVALLAMLRPPVVVPAAVGVKLTVSVRLDPAATVVEPEKPLRLNPEPLTAACEIMTAPVPEFVKETARDVEDPTIVFANVRLLVLSESR